MPNHSMLIVDDDATTLRSLERLFVKKGFEVTALGNGAEALEEFQRHPGRDVCLLDIHLPGRDGIEVLTGIRERDRTCPVVIMTAFASVDTAVSALQQGATDYIIKPFEVEQILLVVDRILERKRLLEDNREFVRDAKSRFDFSRIVTVNPQFIDLLTTLKKVAPTDSSILVTGESGTGKELVARAIHHGSSRAHRPLVAVNCAAIPPSLMESELFGHVRGAFTGAVEDRKGYFERASGSTLFLDEIGELTVDLQVKLLRVLQERQIGRVGEGRPVDVDFRLVAATQRDLARDAHEGRFRLDLFYRLNVIPVYIPPLRERPEDIPHLVTHFLKRFRRPEMRVSGAALDLLARYSWPGNVRELENVIERAVILCEGPAIEPAHLAQEIRGAGPSSERGSGIAVHIPPKASGYKQVLREVEDMARRQLISRALAQHGHNVTHTARALGVSRRHLISLMGELKLRAPHADAEEEED